MSDELNLDNGNNNIDDNNLNHEDVNLNQSTNTTISENNNPVNSNPENSIRENSIPENQDNVFKNNSSSSYGFWAEQIAASSYGQPEQTYNGNAAPNNYASDNSVYNNSTNNNNTYGNQNNNPYVENREYKQDQFGFNNSSVFDAPTDNNKPKKKSFLRKAVKFVLGAAVFGAVAGAAFIGFNVVYYGINPDATPFKISVNKSGGIFGGYELSFGNSAEYKISTTTVTDGTIEQKTDVTNVVEETMPSIVTITTENTETYDWFGQQYDQESEGGGSGIIVGKNDKELLIATNNHVVEGAQKITIKFIDDTDAEAIVKGTDSVADLAVVSIDLSQISADTLKKIEVAKLGDSDDVKVGEMVIAIGNALGYGQSTTVGYVSAKDREVQVEDKKMVLLQTDAAINPGNSGGALLNMDGEVIGINSVKYASSEVEGMGFAIPISRATPIINELMNREVLTDDQKGYLGVYIQDVTEDIAQTYNWPVGVYVTSTAEGGSAEKAGIKSGDIITKVNDTEITSGTQLKEKVTSYRVGTEITITVMRSSDGQFTEKQIKVTLGKNPESSDSNN